MRGFQPNDPESPDPILNFRAKQSTKDALHLHAGRIGKDPGPLMREWVTERLVQETALEKYRAVGLTEVLRRLSQPSPAFAYPDDNTESGSGVGQTEANVVLHGKTAGSRT